MGNQNVCFNILWVVGLSGVLCSGSAELPEFHYQEFMLGALRRTVLFHARTGVLTTQIFRVASFQNGVLGLIGSILGREFARVGVFWDDSGSLR